MRIGVTGHRELDSSERLVSSLRTVLEEARGLAESRQDRLVLYSPLAEGADRLAVRIALALDDIELQVLLPLPVDVYRCDFETAASRREFEELLQRATQVETLPAQASRLEAYREVGKALVRRSDLLLAVWDGLPARGLGGTAEVVALARAKNLPLYWINTTRTAEIIRERI